MSDVRVLHRHEEQAADELGGWPEELAEEEVGCDNHSFGYYCASNTHIGRACMKCGTKKAEVDETEKMWLSEEDLPEDYETFDRERVEKEHEENFKQEKSYYEAELDALAERIAKDESKREAKRLTPKRSASSAEWKRAFDAASHSDSWAMIKRSYMKSDAWRQRRAEKASALESDHCAARLPGCDDRFDHLHHKSYDNIGCEPLWDLAPVCHNCHSIIHGEKAPPTSEAQESDKSAEETEKMELPF